MTVAADWQSAVGDIWAVEWRRTDRSFAELSPHLDAAILAAARPGAGRAVDIGCGAGQTSIALAMARPDLAVTGVDISPELVRIAGARGEGLANLRFVTADVAATADALAAGADLLFSRHGVMFFADPDAVFTRLHATVAPGARLVFSCFRAPTLNPWAAALVTAITGQAPVPVAGYAPGPFGFADAEWTTAMLIKAGWRDVVCRPIDYRYAAGEGDDSVGDAVGFFRRIGPVAAAFKVAPEGERPAMLARLSATLDVYRDGDRVAFPAAAWLWTARASATPPPCSRGGPPQ